MPKKRTLLFTLYVVISSSLLSGIFPFSRPIPDFMTKSLLYTPKPRATLLSTCSTVHGTQVGGKGGPLGGVEASLDSYVPLNFSTGSIEEPFIKNANKYNLKIIHSGKDSEYGG